MFDNNSKPILVIGVSPLWELEYTGISNVVFELAKRFFFDQYSDFDVRFSVFDKLVDRCIIEQCLKTTLEMPVYSSSHKGETPITNIGFELLSNILLI
jgi:hypothetical protein